LVDTPVPEVFLQVVPLMSTPPQGLAVPPDKKFCLSPPQCRNSNYPVPSGRPCLCHTAGISAGKHPPPLTSPHPPVTGRFIPPNTDFRPRDETSSFACKIVSIRRNPSFSIFAILRFFCIVGRFPLLANFGPMDCSPPRLTFFLFTYLRITGNFPPCTPYYGSPRNYVLPPPNHPLF